MRVLVLMSTYNGERFLAEQIESVLKQEGVTVHLLIRDDGSSDRTVPIIEGYLEKHPNISLIKGDNSERFAILGEIMRQANRVQTARNRKQHALEPMTSNFICDIE